ncbi:hypothetical protein, partial [Vibrio sp. 10N.222.55.C12]|uniref:hypothetical protein n=1 Tax=Vibrio sp. 10N.222.55.C12 TaxID=1884470 RepID=UPI001A7E11EB
SLFNRQLSPEVPKILDSYYIASSMTVCGELNPYMGKGGEECLLKHFISMSSVSLPTSTLNHSVILSSTQDLRAH